MKNKRNHKLTARCVSSRVPDSQSRELGYESNLLSLVIFVLSTAGYMLYIKTSFFMIKLMSFVFLV